ncbi:hypothetical protein PR202_ga25525 [Eleusine coracana subsp. coracana]|uniref:Uncharacterized protein n=1 Tax=Eleusine coracana subsp. coracana TaxID=191504 RepID=A0AAV5DC55_ELECO|nr:hypothetical protein PR202_ga25525 [Eleusine coracana subsp. coracana]
MKTQDFLVLAGTPAGQGRGRRLTVGLEVTAGVDGLEFGDGSASGGNIWRLQHRALDEAWSAASVPVEELGVGDHPEHGVVLHHTALGVQSDPFPAAAPTAERLNRIIDDDLG